MLKDTKFPLNMVNINQEKIIPGRVYILSK